MPVSEIIFLTIIGSVAILAIWGTTTKGIGDCESDDTDHEARFKNADLHKARRWF